MRARMGMLLVLLGSTLLAACSPLGAPPTRAVSRPTSRASALAQVQAEHEYPARKPPPQPVLAGQPSRVGAVRAFAVAYINWGADTVAARLRALASQSVGQARSAMQLAAAQAAGDYELRRGGIANHGTVEAVAPLAGAVDRFVVVTRESTTATLSTAYQGLRPAWHVTVATVTHAAAGGWVLDGWQPES